MADTGYHSVAAGLESGNVRRLRTVDDLRLGDNACFIYTSEQEYQSVLTSFVRTGLEQRQRVLYLHDFRSPQNVGDMLRNAGVDVDRAEA